MKISGRKFIVTAGPTVERIDPVRFISNHSTGKMGYAVAEELAARGGVVTLVSGPVALDVPAGVKRIDVTSANEMYSRCAALWNAMDGAVMCAAVADYTPREVSATKIKKQHGTFSIEFVPTKDIAAHLCHTRRPGQLVVGFALETDNEQANALSKLRRKGLDMIVLNSLRDEGAGFGVDTNRIAIFKSDGSRADYPLGSKRAAAGHIADAIEAI